MLPHKPTQQIPMDLAPAPEFSFDNFVEAPSNLDALVLVKGWQLWPSPVLLLQGPSGAGKTHLGQAWLKQVEGGLFVDDADCAVPQDVFTHINRALSGETGPLLLAAVLPPSAWSHNVPDLHSRMKNTATATLQDPDDELLESVTRKLFEDNGRSVRQDLVQYLILRTPRSVPALRLCVKEIDAAARIDKADLTKAFAARFLNTHPDLFV